MPRFNCESCAAPLYSAALPGGLNDAACPTCGAPFALERQAAPIEAPLEPEPATP